MQTLNAHTIARYRLNAGASLVAPAAARCPTHHLPMLTTQSGLQQVCPFYDCEEHVRADGPRKEDHMKATNKTETAPKITLPPKMTQEDRAKLVEQAVKAKKAPVAPTPKPEKKAKPEKKTTEEGKMSVGDIARSCGVDPKRARARLRSAGLGAIEGRWPLIEKDSKLFAEYVSIINPPEVEETEGEDEGEEDEE